MIHLQLLRYSKEKKSLKWTQKPKYGTQALRISRQINQSCILRRGKKDSYFNAKGYSEFDSLPKHCRFAPFDFDILLMKRGTV